jgi:NAD(P)-dependent dehydrogenase (short-subunit alcohol dehydrogenase family)
MCEDLVGKKIIVTGASGQIGGALSLKLHNLGAHVIGFDLEDSSEDCFFDFLRVDISDEASITKAFQSKIFRHNPLYGLVNNAGYSVFSDFGIRSKEDFLRTLEINLWAPFILIREFCKFLNPPLNSSAWRSIVNVSSVYGLVSPDFRIYEVGDRKNSEVYGSSKSGLLQMTRYFSVALAPQRIRVNAVAPGGIFNEKTPQSSSFVEKYNARVPMNRMANVQEVVNPIIFLLSDASSYMTGSTLVIDGGLSVM